MSNWRDLERMGIPNLPSRAFQKGPDGKILPQGGGDSGGSSQPDKITHTNINIPPYVRPYIESMLGRAEALTTGSQFEPYNPQDRFAPIDPLQQQAYQSAGQLGVSPELDQAGQLIGQAQQQSQLGSQYADMLMNTGLGYGGAGFGIGQQYQQSLTDPSAIQSHMSPYMQNVVDMQKQEAIRDYQKQLPQLQAQMTMGGAYGGGRHAVLEAEGMRNLNRSLQDIQTQGQQQAYSDALQNMYQGAQMGMQGAQTGLQGVGQGIGAAQLGQQNIGNMLQGAGILGQLGQQRFGQQTGIIDAQQALGGMMQQQQQQIRDFDYQQFMDELNFPYQQLAFMADMTQGLPLSQSTMYQTSPQQQFGLPQLLGLGMQGYGLANRAQGGRINKPKLKYAAGGQVEPVPAEPAAFDTMSDNEIAAAVAMLSDEQLAQYAQLVQDEATLNIIQAEMRSRQRVRAQAEFDPSSINPGGGSEGAMPAGGLGAVPQVGLRMQDQVAQQVPQPQGIPFASGGQVGGLAGLFERGKDYGKGLMDPELTAGYTGFMDRIRRLNDVNYGSPTTDADLAQAEAAAAREAMVESFGGYTPEELSSMIPNEFINASPRPELEVEDIEFIPAPELEEPSMQVPPEDMLRAEPPSSVLSATVPQSEDSPATRRSYEDYMSQLDASSDTALDEAMLMDAMRAGLDDRRAQLEVRERRDKMDALIAAGAAMMRGRNLTEGFTLAGEAGSEALREAAAARDALEDSINNAQQAQYQYELGLLRDDRKMAQDSYHEWLRYDQKNDELAMNYKLGLAKIGATLQAAQIRSARGMDMGPISAKDAYSTLNNSPEAKALHEAGKQENMMLPGGAEAYAAAQRAFLARKQELEELAGISGGIPGLSIIGAEPTK